MRRFAVLLLVSAGCASRNYYEDAERWAEQFHDAESLRLEAKEVQARTGARLVKFRSGYYTGEELNDTVWGELYAKHRPTRGALVMLPSAAGGLIVERTLAASLAERGYAVYLMYLPYTELRAPPEERRRGLDQILTKDMDRNEAIMVQTIRDARRGLLGKLCCSPSS